MDKSSTNLVLDKNSPMDNRVLSQIKDFIEKNNTIGIAVGKNPGVDEMGAALSFYLSLASFGKDVTVVCPTQALVEHSRLVGIDKLKSSFDAGSGDLTASFPYKEGEIEKISYTLEDGFLNIIVKAGEEGLNFSENDVIFKRSQGYPGILFVVGTPRLSDLDRIFDPQALKDTVVINIDNKPDNQGFGDISLVSPNNSSLCERMGDLILSLDLPMDIDTAQNLLIGIENATDSYQNTSTSALAFEMVGSLMKKGAVRSENRSSKVQVQKQVQDLDQDQDMEEASVFTPGSLQNRSVQNPSQNQQFQNMQRQSQDKKSVRGQAPLRQASLPARQGSAGPASQAGEQGKNPPVDWLAPKIYKGSTNI